MNPACFIDFGISATFEDAGISPVGQRGLLFQRLHRGFARRPGEHAIALPWATLDTIRVFGGDFKRLAALRDELSGDRWVRDYVHVGPVSGVDPAFDGSWECYQRYRIPTLRSDRHAEGGVSALRERRLCQARERRLDHFRLRSATNAQSFTLTLERLVVPNLPRGGVPNSYGVGTRDAPVGLPVVV